MLIELNDENRQPDGLIEVMKRAAEICAEAEGIDVGDDVCEVSLSFVSPEEIREINRVYRSNDSVTDVLSFPQYADREEMNWEDYLCLGDVIICPERAEEQAEDFGHSFEREMVYLMVHSILHLLGYDHMNDDEKAVMREKEEAVMDKVGLSR